MKFQNVEVDSFTLGYIEALYFTDTGEDEQPSPDLELSPEALLSIVEVCADFQDANRDLLDEALRKFGLAYEYAGHDFWLTRNGHGAGFWDRGTGRLGDELTVAAKAYGGVWTYEGDDDLLHVSGRRRPRPVPETLLSGFIL